MLGILTYFRIRCGSSAPAGHKLPSLATFFTSLLGLQDGESIRALAVVVASGAQYRRLEADRIEEYEGVSVHYWASPLERRLCSGNEVALVGASNSAGQAVVYLSSQVAKVWMIVRGASLEATMARYLCERIAALPNVEVLLHTEVVGIKGGDGAIHAIRLKNRQGRERRDCSVRHLFLFIGAEPNTAWVARSGIDVDSRGFICAEALASNCRLPFETNHPGVFAIGDVRAGSIKRIAAAVGEGAQLVAALHVYLAQARNSSSPIRAIELPSPGS